MNKSLFAAVSVLLIVCVTLSGCATMTTCRASSPSSSNSSAFKSTVTVSKTAIAANASLYHKYFDLDSTQKDELAQRGYSDTQISKVDNEDFKSLESNFMLSDDTIKDATILYPNLKGTDLSTWTYSDFERYSQKQDDITYAPTAKQTQQLQKRCIPLKMARRMLKEYCDYDNLLSQSNSKLAVTMKLYIESDQEYTAFNKEKESVRTQYFKNLSSK